MCSSTDKQVAASDIAMQKAATAGMVTQQQDAALSFGQQQQVLQSLNAKMSYMAANPLGYTPAELHMMTTGINENTATAAKQAIGAAAAYGASHGAADISGGGTAQMAGQIASSAAQSKAQQLNEVGMQNEQLKQANYWRAISGLSAVGSDLGGANATALGASTGDANAATNAGGGAVNAATAENSLVSGLVSGIAGLGAAGASAYKTYEG